MTTIGTSSASAVRAGDELRSLVGRLRRRILELTDNQELTPSQTAVVSRLAKHGPATASDLAAAERVRPQSIATTLARLAERGFIDRTPDPDDGRRQLVSLSAAGAEFFEGRRRAGTQWLATAFDQRFTEAERQTVLQALALLDRLND